MVCHIGGQLGTKVVISALGMLALYMCFNGTGIWGGETLWQYVWTMVSPPQMPVPLKDFFARFFSCLNF